MKFFKLHDTVWLNPDNIAVLRVMGNEVWADDLLLTRYKTEDAAEADFDDLIERINDSPSGIFGRDPHWRPASSAILQRGD